MRILKECMFFFRASFWKEIELFSTLNNSNVCSLLGTLNSQRTVAVFEYSTLDLYQYLRQQIIPLNIGLRCFSENLRK